MIIHQTFQHFNSHFYFLFHYINPIVKIPLDILLCYFPDSYNIYQQMCHHTLYNSLEIIAIKHGTNNKIQDLHDMNGDNHEL